MHSRQFQAFVDNYVNILKRLWVPYITNRSTDREFANETTHIRYIPNWTNEVLW